MFPLCIAAGFVAALSLPEKPSVGFSGIPGIASSNLAVEFHNVTLSIAKDHVDVSSTTLFKNNGAPGTYHVEIPVGSIGGAPTPDGLTATWASNSIPLTHEDHSYGATVTVQNQGSYALRIKYSEPLGRCALDHHEMLAAYDLRSAAPIGTLMVSYSYGPGIVFHLPEVGSGDGWQIGPRGAFLKLSTYRGTRGLSYCAFYPAGFKPIGF